MLNLVKEKMIYLAVLLAFIGCQPSVMEIEAESAQAQYINGARRVDSAQGHVGYLGGTRGGAVTLPLKAKCAGVYRMDITYSSSDQRWLEVILNTQQCYEICVPPTHSLDKYLDQTIYVSLRRGENLVSLGHSSKDAPDIDKIRLTPVDESEYSKIKGSLINADAQPQEGRVIMSNEEGNIQSYLVGNSGKYEFVLPKGATQARITPDNLYDWPIIPASATVTDLTQSYDFVVAPKKQQGKIETHGSDGWQIGYNTNSGEVAILFNEENIFPQIHAAYTRPSRISSLNYSSHTISKQPITDIHGTGICVEIKHLSDTLPELLQRFWLYPNKSYLFTEIEIVSNSDVSTNYMSPLSTGAPIHGFGSQSHQMLFVPFDNDKWVQYNIVSLPGKMVSYEATALFNSESGKGLVVGSIEHDTWKTGVRLDASQNNSLTRLECFGGITSELTRDVLPHGILKGKSVKSPKIMVGIFDDWRDGMEQYALANSRVAPSPKWDKGTPFGWNSWGSIQQKINLEKAIQVSNFFKENIQNNNFSNNNTIYIGLDSFWDNFSDRQLKEFVDYCHSNGQSAGIYWTPFTDWWHNPNRRVEGSDALYKDIYLYADGKTQSLDGALAIDPTHPASLKRIDHFTQRFRKAGFEYIKIDFLTHGAMESDSHANPDITTGIAAYNFGMDYLQKALGNKFFITQAISPIFPSQYAHGRRIACDAFASISDTEYTLNGLSYGWWLGKAYLYNDPDHLVLSRESESEGENRARITSGIITGIYMSGDDLSLAAKEIALKRTKMMLTVKQINDVARIGRSFRPVYGNRPSADKCSENTFMLEHEGVVYLAVFNFSRDTTQHQNLPISSLGLDPKASYNATELWSGEQQNIKGELESSVPSADVKIWKITALK